MSAEEDNGDDDSSSSSSGKHPFIGPRSFPINKLTNKPFQSPHPWQAGGFSGHRLNNILPHSAAHGRPIDILQVSIPAFPSLSQPPFDASASLLKRASGTEAILTTDQAPAAKREKKP